MPSAVSTPLLSIVIPSRRSLEAARFSLETALVYAEKTDSLLIVSDNSGDLEKARWLDGLGPRVRRLQSAAEDAISNLMNGLNAVETPFLMPMGDDDAVFLIDDEAPAIALDTLPEDVISLRPQTLVWLDDTGVENRLCQAFDQATAAERMQAYSRQHGGSNVLYYSLFRTDPFRDMLRHFYAAHPTRGAYTDWIFVITMLVCGRILHDPARLYCYDLGQWKDNDGIQNSNLKLFRQVGMADQSEHYLLLLMFADLYGFLVWPGLPIAPPVRADILHLSLHFYVAPFLRIVQETPALYSATTRAYAEGRDRVCDPHAEFEAALPVLDQLRPGIAEGYRRFAGRA